MANNLPGLAKVRANQWATINKEELNPLGQRLLWLLRRDLPAGQARSPLDLGRNLTTHLLRLKASDPAASLKVEQLVAYARRARVSLVWLITGEGSETDEFYGQATGEEMRHLPAELQRATRALIELEKCGPRIAIWAAEQAYKEALDKTHSATDWLSLARAKYLSAPGESGERPSTRIAAGK